MLELAGAVGLLLVCTVPYILVGQGAYVPIHDILDSEFVYLTHLVRSGTAFEYGTDVVIPNVMNGLPRSALRSGLNFTVVLFHAFDPFVAYVVNALVVRFIAFTGMLVLLRRHLLPEPEGRGASVALALLFALLPFYSLYGVSVAGQPLLLSAYVNVMKQRSRWWDWLMIGLFPFYSLLYMSGLFILAIFALVALYRCLTRRRLDWSGVLPVLVLGAGYLLVEWPMIRSLVLETPWTSHRVAFDRGSGTGGGLPSAVSLLLYGQYHAATLPTLPIVLSLGLGWRPLWRSQRRSLAIGTIVGVLLIVTLHAAYRPVVLRHLGHIVPVLESVQVDRFYFLLPLCWFVLFALALSSLKESRGARWSVPTLLLVQTIAVLSTSDEVRRNVSTTFGGEDYVSFREFFAPDLFRSIQEEIGQSPETYRVLSVGLHPSVSQYNGFYSLDGYQNNYPLAYKHRFRRVIADELGKAPSLARYFDDWGSRCYLFSAELGREFLWGKESEKVIHDLSIDVEQLRSLGGTHLLSSVSIENNETLGLAFVGAFESPESYWRIHLYEVK